MKKVLNSLKMFLCLTLCLVIITGTTGVFEVNMAGGDDAGTEILGDDAPGGILGTRVPGTPHKQ